MKKILILSSLIIFLGILITLGMTNNKKPSEYLRIHIRANSNFEVDQTVKYLVKDAIIEAMIPVLAECKTKEDAEKALTSNLKLIEKVADNVLFKNGFTYTSSARLANEEFPARQYDNLVLEQGFYDALIIDLGAGKGNNWWCVVYPPLCFLKGNATGQDIIYKSKIAEIIKSVIG